MRQRQAALGPRAAAPAGAAGAGARACASGAAAVAHGRTTASACMPLPPLAVCATPPCELAAGAGARAPLQPADPLGAAAAACCQQQPHSCSQKLQTHGRPELGRRWQHNSQTEQPGSDQGQEGARQGLHPGPSQGMQRANRARVQSPTMRGVQAHSALRLQAAGGGVKIRGYHQSQKGRRTQQPKKGQQPAAAAAALCSA